MVEIGLLKSTSHKSAISINDHHISVKTMPFEPVGIPEGCPFCYNTTAREGIVGGEVEGLPMASQMLDTLRPGSQTRYGYASAIRQMSGSLDPQPN